MTAHSDLVFCYLWSLLSITAFLRIYCFNNNIPFRYPCAWDNKNKWKIKDVQIAEFFVVTNKTCCFVESPEGHNNTIFIFKRFSCLRIKMSIGNTKHQLSNINMRVQSKHQNLKHINVCVYRKTFNKAIISEINVTDPHMKHMRVGKKLIYTAWRVGCRVINGISYSGQPESRQAKKGVGTKHIRAWVGSLQGGCPYFYVTKYRSATPVQEFVL